MASEALPHKPGGEIGDDDQPVLAPGHTFGSVTDKISSLVLNRPYNWRWFTGMGSSLVLVSLLTVAIAYLLYTGVGSGGSTSRWAGGSPSSTSSGGSGSDTPGP